MSNRHGRWLFLLVLVAGVSSLAGLWYATSSSQGEDQAAAGVYIEGMTGFPSMLNPLLAVTDTDKSINALIYAGLTRLNSRGEPTGDLAESWTVGADGLSYTFLLRQGLVWPDSVPLTTDDVIFTYQLLQSPTLKVPASSRAGLPAMTMTAIDSRTLRIELLEPYSPLPAYLTLGVLPAHILRDVPPAELGTSPFNQQPFGAGPFRLESMSQENAVLVANESYYGGAAGLERIELHFFEDEGRLLASVMQGRVDGALLSNLNSDDALQLEQDGFTSTSLPTGDMTSVFFNLDLPIFQDRRVRQALFYALDLDAMVAEYLGSEAEPSQSPIAPGNWAYVPALRRYTHDLGAAGQLLNEAGWLLDARGVRMKDGSELAFVLSTNSDPVRVRLSQAIAQRWTALGARVTVQSLGATSLNRDILPARKFDAALLSSAGTRDPDPYDDWHSNGKLGSLDNVSDLSDARFDELLEQGRSEESLVVRREIYREFQELFAQEVPAMPVYASTMVYVQRKSVRGVEIGLATEPGDRFWQVTEWRLED